MSLISPPPHHDIYSIEDLAIAQGKAKAAQADMDLMGFTSIEI